MKNHQVEIDTVLSENHWNHVPAVSVPTFKAQRTEVKMFICTACCLTDLACLIHSMKCCSIWSLCLCATRGNTNPYSRTELSITATPNGRGPGIGSLWKKSYLINSLKLVLFNNWSMFGAEISLLKCRAIYLVGNKIMHSFNKMLLVFINV